MRRDSSLEQLGPGGATCLLLHSAVDCITSNLSGIFNHSFTLHPLTFSLSPAHSPDNLFLGFVVDKAVAVETRTSNETLSVQKPIGLLYGKKAGYLRVGISFIQAQILFLEYIDFSLGRIGKRPGGSQLHGQLSPAPILQGIVRRFPTSARFLGELYVSCRLVPLGFGRKTCKRKQITLFCVDALYSESSIFIKYTITDSGTRTDS